MPRCSTCGMMVEWARSCYQSRWRLFRDDISKITTGRYYFSRDDGIPYPDYHNLGSRRWYDGNHELIQGLGEDLTCKQIFLDGQRPGPAAEQRSVGTAECLRDGEPVEDAIDPAELVANYPPECYVALVPVDPLAGYQRGSQFQNDEVQLLWARIIELMYLDDEMQITAILTEFFGPGVAITFHPAVNNMPGVVTIVHPEWAIAAIDGTRDAQTFALQGFELVQGPSNQGAYSTIPLWDQAASHVHTQLVADGVNDTRPIFLAGHSYGGATALVLAARYRHAVPGRTIRYLTFGAPKIGDERLAALLRRIDGWSMANDNDWVTILPPDTLTLAPFVILFPTLFFGRWRDWERPPSMMLQADDGQLAAGPPSGMDYTTLLAMLTRIAAGQPVQSIQGHSISEYLRRVRLRIAGPAWPVSLEVWELLEEEPDTEGGLLLADGPWQWEGGGSIILGGVDSPPAANGGLMFDGEDSPAPGNGGISLGGV